MDKYIWIDRQVDRKIDRCISEYIDSKIDWSMLTDPNHTDIKLYLYIAN